MSAMLRFQYEKIRVLDAASGLLEITFWTQTERKCRRHVLCAYGKRSAEGKLIILSDGISRQLRDILLVDWADDAARGAASREGAKKGQLEWKLAKEEWAAAFQEYIDDLYRKDPKLTRWALANLAYKHFRKQRSIRTILRRTRNPHKNK